MISIYTPFGFMQDKNRQQFEKCWAKKAQAGRRSSILTKGAVAVVPLHPALAGSTIEARVALTVVDSGVTSFPCG